MGRVSNNNVPALARAVQAIGLQFAIKETTKGKAGKTTGGRDRAHRVQLGM